jgi:hypothetical protein
VRSLTLGAVAIFALGGLAPILVAPPARGVPAVARQTGLACEACHTIPPELTPFGRRFKLNGYTMTTRAPLISDTDDHKRSTLFLTDLPGINVLLMNAYAHYDRPLPDSAVAGAKAQSDDLQFPEQLSLMYAGAISDHLGGWIQVTYAQPGGTFGIDNTELRYSDHTANNDWVWGVLANNSVSLQDVWSTVPAWIIPGFIVPSLYSMPGLGGASLRVPLYQLLGPGLVAGSGAYLWYKDSLYLELSEYHSAKSGSVIPELDSSNLNLGGGTVDGFAPYWRAAYERDWGYNSIEVGTNGLYTKFVPSVYAGQTLSPGNQNRYLDASVDWEYQHNGPTNIFTFLGYYTHETEENDRGLVPKYFSNSTDHLNELQITGEYYYNRHFGGLMSFVRTTGTPDIAINGGNGSPSNQYDVFELDYIPWLNVKLLLQYDLYSVVSNRQNPFYLDDATHPKASNNNTWVVGTWLDF